MADFQFHSALPYPLVRIQQKSRRHAVILLDNIGGPISEMSTVAAHFHGHLLCASDAQLAHAFHAMRVVEMHHLEIFAQLARLCGADPRLWSVQNRHMTYWTPAYITYSVDRRAILEQALILERKSIDKYERQVREIDDIFIVENLQRVIMDELVHAAYFEQMLLK